MSKTLMNDISKICGYCGKQFKEVENHKRACCYHPQFYFPYDIDKDGIYKKGWQCCGNEDSTAPGCTFSKHDSGIQKVYRINSIVFDYKAIDILKEEEQKKQKEKWAKIKKQKAADPETGPLINEINKLRGKNISVLIKKVGHPADSVSIANGSSGFVHHRKDIFFEYKNLIWVVHTDYEPFAYNSNKNGEYDHLIESISWYADQEEKNYYRKNIILDLTSD